MISFSKTPNQSGFSIVPKISFLETVCRGLKKSKTPWVATPTAELKANILGFAVNNIAIAPQPCVYSPVEFKSYFALSVATTITFFVGFNLR